MHSNDDSWIITTEVEVAFDWKVEAYHDPLWVRVVAIPDEHWMDRSFDNVRAEGSGSPLQVYWDKRKLNVQLYATHVEADNLWILAEYVDQVFTRTGEAWQYDSRIAAEGLFEVVRIPRFGSPPKDWTKLGTLMGAGGGLAGAGIISGVGHEPSLTLVLIAVGATLFVNIVVPVSKALGRGLEHRIDELMGTPPRPPAESE